LNIGCDRIYIKIGGVCKSPKRDIVQNKQLNDLEKLHSGYSDAILGGLQRRGLAADLEVLNVILSFAFLFIHEEILSDIPEPVKPFISHVYGAGNSITEFSSCFITSDISPSILFSSTLRRLDLTGLQLPNWSCVQFPPKLSSLILADTNFTGDLEQYGLKDLRSLVLPFRKKGTYWSNDTIRYSHHICHLTIPDVQLKKKLTLPNLLTFNTNQAKCEDWSKFRFPKGLKVLRLNFSQFDFHVNYLTSLVNLSLRGMHLDDWSRFKFPPLLVELDMRDSNCTKTYSDLENLFVLRLDGIQLEGKKRGYWREIRKSIPATVRHLTWKGANLTDETEKRFQNFLNRSNTETLNYSASDMTRNGMGIEIFGGVSSMLDSDGSVRQESFRELAISPRIRQSSLREFFRSHSQMGEDIQKDFPSSPPSSQEPSTFDVDFCKNSKSPATKVTYI